MSLYTLNIPQMGESIVEARIVRLLKRKGVSVQRDEPLVELETDKSVFTVDSPVEGVIEEWCVTEESTFPVGQLLCHIQYSELQNEGVTGKAPSVSRAEVENSVSHLQRPEAISNSVLSPRIRKYCLQKNIPPEEIGALVSTLEGRKITSEDVDKWCATAQQKEYTDNTVSSHQQSLSAAMVRGWNTIVPGVIESRFDWNALKEANTILSSQKIIRMRGSYLHIIAWCVARAMEKHPEFRSRLIGETTLREYHKTSLGIAVSMPNGDLTMAVIENASGYDITEMGEALLKATTAARYGEAKSSSAQLVISDLSGYGVHSAVPVIVPPAAATLFVGSPFEEIKMTADGNIEKYFAANFVVAFDHRFISGVEAAKFLRDVCQEVEELPGILKLKQEDR